MHKTNVCILLPFALVLHGGEHHHNICTALHILTDFTRRCDCRQPLCRLNGLGEDVTALDFICYGDNHGPFSLLNKCSGLRCKLTVPGCRTGPFGGNCVGYVVVDPTITNPEFVLDPHVTRYIGYPCIEVAGAPHGPKLPTVNLPRINININFHKSPSVSLDPVGDQSNYYDAEQQQQLAGSDSSSSSSSSSGSGGSSHLDGEGPAAAYASGLWTVCDCLATQKHPGMASTPSCVCACCCMLNSTHHIYQTFTLSLSSS